MKIYKFGGASVRCADSVKIVERIIGAKTGQVVVVISAMGKTTNMLEAVVDSYFNCKPDLKQNIERVKEFHYEILDELYNGKEGHMTRVDEIFEKLELLMQKRPSLSYDFEYDKIVSFGEILSTTIISDYLNHTGVENKFVDIRLCIKTDNNYREGNVDYDLSKELTRQAFSFKDTNVYVTQGFIAGTVTNQATTLGREGSDYSAALLASMLNAESVTIWKDVAGVMNGDPKLYDDVEVIRRLSYKEAIELSYCGATIIHPKTIKPLKMKRIPLYVKSFLTPDDEGSVINEFTERIAMPAIYIHKKNQVLITLTPRDFSFIAEEKLSSIFLVLAAYKVKMSLMQTSAISFSLCVDYNQATFQSMVKELQENYEVLYNTDVELVTIRHYTKDIVDKFFAEKTIFVEQRSRQTIRFVTPSV